MDNPLDERVIVITRDPEQAQCFDSGIRELGGTAIQFPTIRISETGDWSGCDEAINKIGQYDWIIFSSSNSVKFFLKRAREKGITKIAARIAAVGSKTEDALRRNDLHIDLVPKEFTARGLLEVFSKMDLRDKKILHPVSNIARRELAEGLIKLGAEIDAVEVYRTEANRELDSGAMQRKIEAGQVDCITFFSPSAFHFFLELFEKNMVELLARRDVKLAAIGPTTTRAIKKMGLDVQIVPQRCTEEDLLEELVHFFNK